MVSKQKIGILGYGEIGQAVAKFYKNPLVKDLKRDDGLKNIDILHICIPWSESFVDIVKKEIKNSEAKLTIVHSTVAPNTIKKIGGMVVHVPVRGVHPKLYEGIKTFVNYIGADSRKAAKIAEDHFKKLKVKTKTFFPAATTEIGKLLDTTYYGLVIAWHGEMKKMCDKLGVNFDSAITDFNQTYNEGYKKLGKHNVIRPVLLPPNSKIGGHCIMPNAKLLKKHFKSKGIDLVLDYE